jgi:hypothetical protein
MKIVIIILTVVVGFLWFKLEQQQEKISLLERNAAIAILSAEIANDKIGAFAPYFREDKEKFIKKWIDGLNMPPAIFDEGILIPLRKELEAKRNDSASVESYQLMMGGAEKP